MRERSTFILLDRNLQEWRWYQDANTLRVWLYILLNAYYASAGYYGIDIHPGQLPRSYERIASELNLTYSEVRTAISHLKSTGEITIKRYPKFLLITVQNWRYYQRTSQSDSQSLDNQIAITSQSHDNNINNINNTIKEKKGAPNGDDWRNQ